MVKITPEMQMVCKLIGTLGTATGYQINYIFKNLFDKSDSYINANMQNALRFRKIRRIDFDGVDYYSAFSYGKNINKNSVKMIWALLDYFGLSVELTAEEKEQVFQSLSQLEKGDANFDATFLYNQCIYYCSCLSGGTGFEAKMSFILEKHIKLMQNKALASTNRHYLFIFSLEYEKQVLRYIEKNDYNSQVPCSIYFVGNGINEFPEIKLYE